MPTESLPVSQLLDSPLKSIDELMLWSHLQGNARLGDALLEIRAAYRNLSTEPEALVSAFLRNRRLIAKYDYLWSHRFRRWLEHSFQLRLETPAGGSRLMSLDLSWSSLERTLNHARREHFEHFDDDWKNLTLNIEPHL